MTCNQVAHDNLVPCGRKAILMRARVRLLRKPGFLTPSLCTVAVLQREARPAAGPDDTAPAARQKCAFQAQRYQAQREAGPHDH